VCTPQAEAAFDGAVAASEGLQAAKVEVATALASLETARRVTQSSLEAMQATAGPAQTGAAAATLQRFLDDVERVLGQANAKKGEEPRALAPATPAAVVEESGTTCLGSHAAAVPPPSSSLESQVPEPVAAPVAPAVPVLASPMVEVEDFEPLPALKSPSQQATEETEPAVQMPPAEEDAKPPALQKAPVAAPALAIPLKNVRIAALRARADSPPGGFGSPFAGDHESSLSEGKPLEGGHNTHIGEATTAAPEQQQTRAASPARPRVLTVPVPTASSPPSPSGSEADGGSDGKGKKAASAAGWMGGALNTLFGVVAVPERKPGGGDRDGQAGSAEEGQPAGDLGSDLGSARPEEEEPATPTLFLAAAAAAVAAAPATPPGLESPPVSPRLRPASDAASGEPRAASPRGLMRPQHRSSPSLTTWAAPVPESPPPLPPLPPSAPAAPSPSKPAVPPVPSTAAAAFAAGAGAPRNSVIRTPPAGDVSPAGEASDADELAQAAVVAAVAKLMAARGSNDGELASSASPPAARKSQSPLSRAQPSGAVSAEGGVFGGPPQRAAMASSPAQTAAAVAARRRATMAASEADRNELLSFSSRAAPSPERPSPAPPTSNSATGRDGESAWRPGKADAVSSPEPSGPPEAAMSLSRGIDGGNQPVMPGRYDDEVNEPPPAAAEETTTGWSWTLDSLAAALTGSFTSMPTEQDGAGDGEGWMSNMLGGGEEGEAPLQMRRSLDGRTPLGQKSWTRMC
jgi:hypothetical protein